MSNTKLLQAILDNVVTIKNDLKNLDRKLTKRINDLDRKLTKRIDTLGQDLAILDDDAPTREEHDNLEKRVTKIEKKIVQA